MSSPSSVYPSSFISNAAPAPPPKPSNTQPLHFQTSSHQEPCLTSHGEIQDSRSSDQTQSHEVALAEKSQDPGDQWLPSILENKSKQNLTEILSKPKLLASLAHAASTAHPSVAASQVPLQITLAENIALASHLNELEMRLDHLRSSTQAQLLSTHALERQWRQKQIEIDRALTPFAPSSLYQKLSQGVQEQEMVCRALEESFLDGDGGTATEREVTEWARRYREAKKLYYLRQERKERWDKGRVGGWR